jgi:HTH-type transcriptional regulator / antitoxin HigA
MKAGEFLERVLKKHGMSQRELAMRTEVTPKHVCCIVTGKNRITAEYAIRLEYALGYSAWFWLNLQVEELLVKARARNQRKGASGSGGSRGRSASARSRAPS